jgi:AraC-like DNA-binding protein
MKIRRERYQHGSIRKLKRTNGFAWEFRYRVSEDGKRKLHNGADLPWAELALRCGYYDQSHFANDFRAFSGRRWLVDGAC